MIGGRFFEEAVVADPMRTRPYVGILRPRHGPRVPVRVELSDSGHEASEISCKLLFGEERASLVPVYDDDRKVTIDLESPIAGTLRMYHAFGLVHTLHEATFKPSAYELVTSNGALAAGLSVQGSVRLTSRGLLSEVNNRLAKLDGTLERREEDRAPITWRSDRSEFSLQMKAEWSPASASTAKGLLVVFRPTVDIALHLESSTEIGELLDLVSSQLEAPLLLFSLISRQLIHGFDLRLFVRPTSESRHGSEAYRRTDEVAVSRSHKDEKPLFDEEYFSAGRFEELVNRFVSLPRGEELRRSIRYLLASYREDAVDTQYFLAFAALETLLNALETVDKTLPDARVEWATLDRALQRIVRCYSSRHDLDGALRKSLETRVQNLKAPSFLEKLHRQIVRLGVDTNGLWINYRSGADDFQVGLKAAYGARNALLHNTSIRDLQRLVSDLARLQALFERILCVLIGASLPGTSRGLENARWESRYSDSGL